MMLGVYLLLPVFQLFRLAACNTEKTIFVAPDALTFPSIHPGLDDLRLATLAPLKHQSSLRTKLNVVFPTESYPRGTQHWYILDGLRRGQRYEVRVCWVATQPTEFWLTTYSVQEVFETPSLISALATYSERRQELSLDNAEDNNLHVFGADNSTVLFLHIQSAADFYTTNRTLMDNPPDVDVDIILDPFLLNVLPESLVPTIAYITLLVICSWFLASSVWKWLSSIANTPDKEHRD